jgi:hypothetical protein
MKIVIYRWLTVFAVVVALGLLVQPAHAQSQVNGTLTGTITDVSGAVVSGANVTATNKSTAVQQTTSTNNVGVYVFADMPPGTYELKVEKGGFQACVGAGIILDPAQTHSFSCSLKPGTATETVTVDASALQVDTGSSQVNGVINSTQTEELPVNGRNFANFLAVQPGVSGLSFDSMNSMNIFATQGVGVNGLRDEANNILVEGVTSTRTRDNAAETAAPTIDAIGEINIVTAGYMPEYSRGAGGQIIVQLKSGTDHYHGSLYEYNQNTDYDAASNALNPGAPTAPINWNNFGGTIGGPVIPGHKKLFFFYSQDVTRQPSTSIGKALVPTTLAQQGNFSEYCNAGLACPAVPAFLNGQKDPNTGQTLVTGQPFPNDTIAKQFWSANGSALLAVYPAPNVAGLSGNTLVNPPLGFNYTYPQNSAANAHVESLKVDFVINPKNHLAVTLRHYRQDSFGAFAGGSPQLLSWNIQEPERGATADLATTFSSTLINDLTVGSTEDIVHVVLPPGLRGNGNNRTSVGINYPYIFGNASKDVAGKTPTVSFGSGDGSIDVFNVDTDAYPSSSIGHIYQFQDVVTKILGKHIIKFGAWIEKDGERDDDQLVIGGQNLNGQMIFNSTGNPYSTGSPLADSLLGAFANYTELGFRNQTPWTAWQQGYFVQDSYKVTPRLTIQGGVRWDYFPPYHSSWCNFSMFDPATYSTTAGAQQVLNTATGAIVGGNYYNGIAAPCSQLPANAYNHFGVFGEPFNSSTAQSINSNLTGIGVIRGLSGSILPSHYNNWQPRLGFSWDPFGTGKTTIRGSGGVFYYHATLSDQTQMGRNVPFQTAASVNNGDIDCPAVPQNLNGLANTFGCGTGGAPFVPGPVVPSVANPQQPIPITGQDLNAKVPEVYQWHLDVQHMLPQNTLLDVAYVGTQARHLSILANLNELQPGTCLGATVSTNDAPACVNKNLPFAGFSNSNFTYQLNEANSSYNALQISAQRRMTHNLMFTLAYTFANWIDDGSAISSSIVDHYDLAYNRGPADSLRHHSLTLTYVYDLPTYKRNQFTERVLGGWELAGVIVAATGIPGGTSENGTITDGGSDAAGMGVDAGEHAQLVAGCNPNNAPHTQLDWFNGACFMNPLSETPGTLGNSGRNLVWGPGFWDWDFALYKRGNIFRERVSYQLRAEAYNVLNHVNWNGIQTNIFAGNFGQVNSNGNPRTMQLGLRLIF